MNQRHAITRRSVLAGSAGMLASPAIIRNAAAATRGVTDTEIVIGTMTDLSGVTAVQGVNNANAMRLAFDEVNARGGIHGRKIKWIVEDNEYIVPKAVQAMNKLLNRDNIFFALGNGGTPHNDAVMPSMFEKNVPNVFPLTCARSMYEPFNRLKFGQFASYYDQMRAGVKFFVEQRGKKVVGSMYQDTDFGRDVMGGVWDQTKAMGISLAGETTHKPTDADFSAQVAKLRDADCDLILLGTITRDTNQITAAVRKIGWKVDMLGQVAIYDAAVADVPGNANEGLYGLTSILFVGADDKRPAVQEFVRNYRAMSGRDPNFAAQVGWTGAQLLILGLQRAGRDLNVDSFIKGMESIKDYEDIFGSPKMTYGPDKRQGSNESFLVQVHDSKWVPVLKQPIGY